MVSYLKTFTNKGCSAKKNLFLGEFSKDKEVIQQGSGGYTTRIRRLYIMDQEFMQQGSGGYVFGRNYRASTENFSLKRV